jgi:hypothetical protein
MIFLSTESDCATVTPQAVPESQASREQTANVLIEVGDDPGDRHPKKSLSRPGTTSAYFFARFKTVFRRFSPGEPLRRSRSRKDPSPETFLSGVSFPELHRSTGKAILRGWRGAFWGILILHIPREFEGSLQSAAHDQYATIPEKCHVVQNRVFSQNARKPFVPGGLLLFLVNH